MFRGISTINLDTKGRMAIPSRYRLQIEKEANSQLIVTIDTQNRCLLLYPLPEWELIERKIEALPSFNPTARRIQRLLIGHATEVELDSNARILLPPLLREYAVIDKRVMLVGQGKKFEIWDEGQWQGGRDEWLVQTPLLAADLPEELKSLSL
jgi:MraZ protein